MKFTKGLFCLLLLARTAFAQTAADDTGSADETTPEVTAERKLVSATILCTRAVLKACKAKCRTKKFVACVNGAVKAKCPKSLKNKTLKQKKKFTALINKAVKAKCPTQAPSSSPSTSPTFNPDTCIVDDGGVCGGIGHNGYVSRAFRDANMSAWAYRRVLTRNEYVLTPFKMTSLIMQVHQL